jgi:cytochrome c553
MSKAKALLGGLFLLQMLFAGAAFAQDAAIGRTLYVTHCARCHADPPGSGSVNPLVRTADEIRGALGRVSPMRMLNGILSDKDLQDIAAYFVTVLGEPTNAPDFTIAGQWWDLERPWMALVFNHFANRKQLSGIWHTFDDSGNAVWLYFIDGAWTGPSIYTGKLYRNSGPPYAQPADPAKPPATAVVGEVAIVFSNRESADITFIVNGQRMTRKIARYNFPR